MLSQIRCSRITSPVRARSRSLRPGDDWLLEADYNRLPFARRDGLRRDAAFESQRLRTVGLLDGGSGRRRFFLGDHQIRVGWLGSFRLLRIDVFGVGLESIARACRGSVRVAARSGIRTVKVIVRIGRLPLSRISNVRLREVSVVNHTAGSTASRSRTVARRDRRCFV